jgi:phosphoribosylformylglycinamidine synthase
VDLFGESSSRIVATVDPGRIDALLHLAGRHGVPMEELGTVGGDSLVVELAGAGATGAAEERGSRVADTLEVPVEELERVWVTGLARALGWDEAA